jgi:hypothetical protein
MSGVRFARKRVPLFHGSGSLGALLPSRGGSRRGAGTPQMRHQVHQCASARRSPVEGSAERSADTRGAPKPVRSRQRGDARHCLRSVQIVAGNVDKHVAAATKTAIVVTTTSGRRMSTARLARSGCVCAMRRSPVGSFRWRSKRLRINARRPGSRALLKALPGLRRGAIRSAGPSGARPPAPQARRTTSAADALCVFSQAHRLFL